MPTIDRLSFPDELYYDGGEHLWVRPASETGGLVTVGVDSGGQDALGAAVYVQLEQPGLRVARGEAVGSVEAEKMVRPILAPVSGTLREVNGAVAGEPGLLNQDPYGAGWLVKIEAEDWEAERGQLLHGVEAVTAWVTAMAKISAHEHDHA